MVQLPQVAELEPEFRARWIDALQGGRQENHLCLLLDSPVFTQKNPPRMAPIIQQLVEAIYSEPRAGRLMPSRIELGSDLFPGFQHAHREAMAAVLPEAEDLYPGSLCGVPVIEGPALGAVLVRLDGSRSEIRTT